jgi:hypothetical protein
MGLEHIQRFHKDKTAIPIIEYEKEKQEMYHGSIIYSEQIMILMLVDYINTLETLLNKLGVPDKIVSREFDLAVQRMWRDMNLMMYHDDQRLMLNIGRFRNMDHLLQSRETLGSWARASLHLALAELSYIGLNHSIKKVLRDKPLTEE